MSTHVLFTEAGAKLYTTDQAASMLDMTRNALVVWLHRHRIAQPARKVKPDLFWSEGEIAHVRTIRAGGK